MIAKTAAQFPRQHILSIRWLLENTPPHIVGLLQGEPTKWHWSEDELKIQCSLSVEVLSLLPGRTDSGRLGYAILLKFFQFQGFFPRHQKSTSHEIPAYFAQATNSAPADFDVYDWSGRHRPATLQTVSVFFGTRPCIRREFAVTTHMADRRSIGTGRSIKAVTGSGGRVLCPTVAGAA
ncbi:MAG: DUF4158 domain-containing protein [Glaciimonas sp.]|nr:DUF4158 domain-containing protein [Glaciimonas sp.]